LTGAAAAAAALVLAGCASSSIVAPAVDARGSDRAARRPDAVALDLPVTTPVAVSRAEAGGVVALRVPVSREAVAGLLRSFFDAWAHESIDDLIALLVADAGPIEARSRGSRVLVDGWRQRMRSHEYGHILGVQMSRSDRIERWEPDELGSAGAPAHIDAHPGEIAVRVPVEVPQVAGDRLFGDAVVMLLRPDPGGLRIAAYGEVEPR
jgi:hypothetical protein